VSIVIAAAIFMIYRETQRKRVYTAVVKRGELD